MLKKYHKILLVLLALSLVQIAFINVDLSTSSSIINLNLDNIKRINRSISLIQHEYYDPNRIKPKEMLKEGFYELAKEIPEVLPKFSNNKLEFFLGPKKIVINIGHVNQLKDVLVPISKAFDFLKANYKGKAKFDDMEYAFIGGMLSVLDPHSNILPPKAYEEFRQTTQGEYGGLGIVIGIKDKGLTIIAPIEDTPAYRAGLAADDKILQIDDQSTTNMSLTEAVDLMRGRPGTKVTLKVKSKNIGIRNVEITRQIIIIKSVVSKLITKNGKHFGVVRVKGFQEDTYRDAVKELKNLQKQSKGNLSGIILDMRNNPGGLLDQAILLADKFLEGGDIVYTIGAGNVDEEIAAAKKQNSDITVPMIVLINQGSASASEIVAGALKNNNRAIVMGQKSFGKGSVQSLFSLRDSSSLKLTVSQYLTPGRESIQAIGIYPDIHLYPSMINDEYYDLIEDINFGEDKLDAHLNNKSLVKKSKPIYTLSYLDEKNTKDKPESSYVSKIKEGDFTLNLAVDILDQASSDSTTEMLSKMEAILNSQEKIQDALIIEALKKRGVDWTKGQQINNPNISVSHQFLNENGAHIKEIEAGTTVKMKVTVKNNSSQPLYRVITDVDSRNPLINHKEFVFGKINPGEERSAEITVKVPPEIISFSERIKLVTYTEKTLENPSKKFVETMFVEKVQPQLAYSYKINDGNGKFTSGNNNGIPEKGEKVNLEISVKNLGPGDSKNTIINIKNKEGKFVFLKKARDTIGLLKPKDTITKNLIFDIKKDFDKDDFTIDFFAIDDDTKASINDTLKFHLVDPKSANPQPDQLQIAPSITISDETKQTKDKLLLVGTATDPIQLKDIAIFVRGRKLIYINLEDGTKTKKKAFRVELPLEDGINSVVIQARGQRDLNTQKSLSVVYDKDAFLVTAQQ